MFFVSWRRARRASHEGLRKDVIKNYRPLLTKEALIMLDDLCKNPSEWDHNMRR